MGYNISKEGTSKDSLNSGFDSTSNPAGSGNRLNELQILSGHKDIVRLLVKLDEFRIASASDDGNIIIWNFLTGQRLLTLSGHTRPITCLLLLDRHTLASGSSDKSIRLWNIYTGACESVLENAHSGSVQCLARLKENRIRSNKVRTRSIFISGGNDQQLCVWKTTDEDTESLIATIHREEEENLHCLLPISGQQLITASNSSFLFVYRTDNFKFVKMLAYHRESVRCLASVSDILFASGSLDGSIVLWQSETLTPLRILSYPEKYFHDHVYTHSVGTMLSLGQRYLAAAIGNGFCVYDVSSGTCLMNCTDAHQASVLGLIALYDGTRLVSCSADACIKAWAMSTPPLSQEGTSDSDTKMSGVADTQPVGFGSRLRRFGRQKTLESRPACVGEMWGHSDAVYCLLAFTDDSMASCGADGLVFLWKDGQVQTEIRNRWATAALMQHNLDHAAEFPRSPRSSSNSPQTATNISPTVPDTPERVTEAKTILQDQPKARRRLRESFDLATEASAEHRRTGSSRVQDERELSSTPFDDSILFVSTPNLLPPAIIEYAEILRVSKGMQPNQVAESLIEEGHSEEIAGAYLAWLDESNDKNESQEEKDDDNKNNDDGKDIVKQ